MSGPAHPPGRVRLLDPAAVDPDAEHDWLPEALAAIDAGPVTPASGRRARGAPLAAVYAAPIVDAADRRPGREPLPAPHTIHDLHETVAARWSPDARLSLLTVESSLLGFIAWQHSPSPSPMERGSGGGVTARTIAILALAVRHPLRNLGYGAEAVEELEQQEPAGAYLAAVPRTNGLAIYFWLRAGYRPLRPDEDETRALDPAILWMRRSSRQAPEHEPRPLTPDT